jgi:hypothetical protein
MIEHNQFRQLGHVSDLPFSVLVGDRVRVYANFLFLRVRLDHDQIIFHRHSTPRYRDDYVALVVRDVMRVSTAERTSRIVLKVVPRAICTKTMETIQGQQITLQKILQTNWAIPQLSRSHLCFDELD